MKIQGGHDAGHGQGTPVSNNCRPVVGEELWQHGLVPHLELRAKAELRQLVVALLLIFKVMVVLPNQSVV